LEDLLSGPAQPRQDGSTPPAVVLHPAHLSFEGHFPRKMDLLAGSGAVVRVRPRGGVGCKQRAVTARCDGKVRVRSMDAHAYVLSPAGMEELCSLRYAGDQVDVQFHYRCEHAYALHPMVAVQTPGHSATEGVERAADWNDDKLERERSLYEGCVRRRALALAMQHTAGLL